jgi:hypothetical protein
MLERVSVLIEDVWTLLSEVAKLEITLSICCQGPRLGRKTGKNYYRFGPYFFTLCL